MAEAIRFHIDENVDHDVARGLRNRGIDVTTATDADLIGALDEEHIEFAVKESRVVFTHDPDFLQLHGEGKAHDGIVFCHSQSRTTGQLISFLALVHDCLSPDEMRGEVEYA